MEVDQSQVRRTGITRAHGVPQHMRENSVYFIIFRTAASLLSKPHSTFMTRTIRSPMNVHRNSPEFRAHTSFPEHCSTIPLPAFPDVHRERHSHSQTNEQGKRTRARGWALEHRHNQTNNAAATGSSTSSFGREESLVVEQQVPGCRN
jgi:hypothetical protein